jgi:hypothetical protein
MEICFICKNGKEFSKYTIIPTAATTTTTVIIIIIIINLQII